MIKQVIQTERLTIKPFEEADKPMLALLLTNDAIKETFMIPDYPTHEALNAAVDKLFDAALSGRHFVRGIFVGSSLIGLVNEVEAVGDSIEIGYAIHPDYQNHGYATEAFRAVIDEMLCGGYSKVTAGAFIHNTASLRVMQKCGMKKSDEEEDIFYHGKNMHCVYYEVIKPLNLSDVEG